MQKNIRTMYQCINFTMNFLTVSSLCLWLLTWLVFKSTEFVATIVVILCALKLQTFLVTNVTKIWHLLVCSCNCDYLLELLCILNEKVDEKWIHVNSIIDHIQWQTSFFTLAICIIELACQIFISAIMTIYCD